MYGSSISRNGACTVGSSRGALYCPSLEIWGVWVSVPRQSKHTSPCSSFPPVHRPTASALGLTCRRLFRALSATSLQGFSLLIYGYLMIGPVAFGIGISFRANSTPRSSMRRLCEQPQAHIKRSSQPTTKPRPYLGCVKIRRCPTFHL